MKSQSFFIGNSPIAQALRRLVSTIANSNATVLITGESGTGKELLARSLHEQSDRVGGAFVPINCSAIPKELLESELFGHRKGSFTGAVADRIGRFELAHGGTIFLDEIGDMSLDMQVKLLRVLQERLIDPVGATRQVPIDVRVIAATHRDLEAEIQAGRFREDLYYRLNVLPVVTPPLRERKEDIPELLRFYASHYKLGHTQAVRFSTDFLQALVDYPWPGNVRELCNLIDRFSTLYAGQELDLRAIPANLLPKALVPIQAELLERSGPATLQEMSLPPEVLAEMQAAEAASPMVDQPEPQDNDIESIIMLAQGMPHLPPEGMSLKDRLAEIERNIIEQALERSQGNVSRTAKLLNLQRTTLIEKINKYELRTA
ncbi:MAG: sigma-54 dependent transcriptional regulator [Burkholderiaceae bacterium]|jgi:sigma-54 specific flagellar transcriptional regulator A|nr:sigma-54 dependent transcriptional regulator [Burkholderiales bacterium]MCE2677273.1 sigma-54 dependent transcriptional regulator [Burkholderiaceae bacterium]